MTKPQGSGTTSAGEMGLGRVGFALVAEETEGTAWPGKDWETRGMVEHVVYSRVRRRPQGQWSGLTGKLGPQLWPWTGPRRA